MTKSLRDTAQALLANWDTPEWNKLSKHAELMAGLRAALVGPTTVSKPAVVGDLQIEAWAKAILGRVPFGYGMTKTEARAYAEVAITAALAVEDSPVPIVGGSDDA